VKAIQRVSAYFQNQTAVMDSRGNHQWQHDMLHTFNSFRKAQTLCDVFLVVDNCRLPAHKVVLAASSPFFKAFFTSELPGGNSGNEYKVDIPEFRTDTENVKELLKYVYTREVEISEGNAKELFVIADFFHILSLRDACTEFLKVNLKPSNCLGIQIFAEGYCQLLYEAASQFINSHLGDIWKAEEFLCYDFDDVKELICGERLDIKMQRKEVLDGIRAWVKRDPDTREHHFAELFSHLRLSEMSLQFITEVINCDEFVRRSDVCEGWVTAELDTRGVTEGIVLLTEEGRASCYTPTTKTWFDLFRLPSFNEVRTTVVCGSEGMVYAIGWKDDRLTIEKFNPQDNIWSQVLWKFTRRLLAAATVEDCIYLLTENGVTRYKPVYNSWQDVAPMSYSRWGLCAVSLNGLVYAIGGHDERSRRGINVVERYDPNNDQWENAPFMCKKRCFASATVMDNKIFVVGGECNNLTLQNCEVYDPTTNTWSVLRAKLCVPRSNAAIANTRRKIFVFGGTFHNGTVECYDKDKEEWTEVRQCPSTMPFKFACTTLLPKALFEQLKGVPP